MCRAPVIGAQAELDIVVQSEVIEHSSMPRIASPA
jgi:hypothetical protein